VKTATATRSGSDARPERDFSKGYAAIFATVIIWSTPSLFLFYLNRFYDPYAQNFYRYGVACLAVVPFVFTPFGRSGQAFDSRTIIACLITAVPNVIHQITQVVALFYLGPGVFAIFMRTSVIITAVIALIFFPEERWIIRQWKFQIGTLLGVLGATGVFWFQRGTSSGHVPLAGVAIAVTASFCWALYGILVKRPSAHLGPVRSFGLVSLFTTALLFPLTLAYGQINAPLHTPVSASWILVISAITCIAIAHVLYYIAIRELGVALSQTLQLLCPLFALGLSAWIFGEHLSVPQIWSAVILLLGAFLAMRIKPVQATASAEAI